MSAAKFDQVGKLGDWMTRLGTGPPAATLASNRCVSASRSAFRRLPDRLQHEAAVGVVLGDLEHAPNSLLSRGPAAAAP